MSWKYFTFRSVFHMLFLFSFYAIHREHMTLRQHKSIIKEYFFYVQNIESIAKTGKRVAIFSIDFQTAQS